MPKVLITGSAGNLGSHLARYLLSATDWPINLMIHKNPLPPDLARNPRCTTYACDLAVPESLLPACRDSEVIVHFAGVLFAPRPENFLPVTNTQYGKNLVETALAHNVKKFILISFPHVEGPTSMRYPATDRLDRLPVSVHAQTRLAEEQALFSACEGHAMAPVSLRPGMIYGRDILMVSFARKLARWFLLGVWKKPTPIHLISIDDFNACCRNAIGGETVRGIYPLGDDEPTTLQDFLDLACKQWGLKKPWRVPLWSVYFVARLCELFALLFKTRTPFTGDFIEIGRVPYYCDTTRMRRELLPQLKYPGIRSGREIL